MNARIEFAETLVEPHIDTRPPAQGPLDEATVMMVDDESIMTELIQGHLEDGGYSRFVATNSPAQAMALMRQTRPGLLLLDLMMPGISGFDILTQIRADPLLKYTPVIVLTAASNSATKLKALELGATEFLAKPVDSSELLLRVRNTLAFQRYQDRLANHDPITGLPNRHAFIRRLEAVLATANGKMMGLLQVEVEEVRKVRGTLGNRAADRLLMAISQRIGHSVRQGDINARVADALGGADGVARMDGDEFSVLLPVLGRAEHAAEVAKRIIEDLQTPIDLDGHKVFAGASVGISVFPGDGKTADALIKSADLAISQAKTQGRSRYAFFSPELNARSYERLLLSNQLQGALERKEFRMLYQPKIDLTTGRISGAEALIRWQHPELGTLLPARFIPLAEELGLIGDIGEWALQTACAHCADWARQGHPNLKVAVNVSKSQFEGGRFFKAARQTLQSNGLDPSQLIVEITESVLMDDVEASLALLLQIKGLGANLSIDDFGTGYSSLSYLKRFPVDELKIDRSFIADLPGGSQDLAIVRAVVTLGHSLGMTVVAEGVEHPAQLKAVKSAECDGYQGFLLSAPVSSRTFIELLG